MQLLCHFDSLGLHLQVSPQHASHVSSETNICGRVCVCVSAVADFEFSVYRVLETIKAMSQSIMQMWRESIFVSFGFESVGMLGLCVVGNCWEQQPR